MKEIPAANWLDILLLCLGRRKRIRVQGSSMMPFLSDGDEVLIDGNAEIFSGDIVCAAHPQKQKLIIKRVREIDKNENFFLIGDNPEHSTDSRNFGLIPRDKIIGRVVRRIK